MYTFVSVVSEAAAQQRYWVNCVYTMGRLWLLLAIVPGAPSLTFINPVQPGNFPDPGVLQLQGRLGTTDITTDKMLHSLYPF